jgi:hypothetical protein
MKSEQKTPFNTSKAIYIEISAEEMAYKDNLKACMKSLSMANTFCHWVVHTD